MSMGRKGETVHAFELSVAVPLRPEQPIHVSVIPTRVDFGAAFPELLHTFAPIDREGRLARALENLGAVTSAGATPFSPGPTALPRDPHCEEPPLTSREKEILEWVAAGLPNKDIAAELEISLATVRNHIHSILDKLDVHSKLEAVSLAFRTGWVAQGGAAVKGASTAPRT
jgi:DNA-binding CsgD family transcriptional regulator